MRRPWCGRCSGPWTSGTAAADPSRPGCRFLSCCVSLDLTERLLPLTVAALAALGFTPRPSARPPPPCPPGGASGTAVARSEEHTSELQFRLHLVYRPLLRKKNVERFRKQET